MNFKMVLFNGIMTALIGAMIGLAIAYISEREARKNYIIVTGSVLGFVLGSFQNCIRQERDQREQEYNEKDSEWE